MTTFQFTWRDGESASERFVRCWDEALAAGPMGDKIRGADYRAFVNCGQSLDLGAVHTSCAVVQRAARHWCGLRVVGNGKPGWPMMGTSRANAWLGELNQKHPAWVKYDGTNEPSGPALFYVEHPRNPNNNHTGALLRKNADGSFDTAEGGGGDGTKTSKGKRTIGPTFDKYGRTLRGWWLIEKMGFPDTETPTVPDGVKYTEAPAFIELKRGDKSARVGAVQLRLHDLGFRLPITFRSGKPDQGYGPETQSAVKDYVQSSYLRFQSDRVRDGSFVDEKIWNALFMGGE